MCRLLGIYGQVDFWKDVVFEFRKLAETGKIPPIEDLTPGHKDGWGMAGSNAQKTAMVEIVRQSGSAYESKKYQEVVHSIKNPLHIFLCHLRKASPNIPISLANVHPFILDGWAFIHNGTLYQAESLRRDPGFVLSSDGSDSEHFFHYLLTSLFENQAAKDKLDILADAVSSVTLEYTALNSLLSDGNELFIIRSCQKYEEYYELFYYHLPDGVIISSEILASDGLNPDRWVSIANNSFLAISGIPPRIKQIQR
ncbi:MAG: class II glutamine amidotransferase [Desulfobacterales bacterium]|jgi:predicted glutamine amidotransferase